MKPILKAPGTNRLKLKYDVSRSNFTSKFNLRRYTKADTSAADWQRALADFQSCEVGVPEVSH